MRVLTRVFFLILILASLGLLLQLSPSTLQIMGLNAANVPGSLSELLNAENREDEFEREISRVRESMTIKAEMIADLIAQKRRLLEVAARFGPAIKRNPHCINAMRNSFPGCNEDEAICRMIILNVNSQLGNRPDRKEVVARLEAELQQHLLQKTHLIPASRAAGAI